MKTTRDGAGKQGKEDKKLSPEDLAIIRRQQRKNSQQEAAFQLADVAGRYAGPLGAIVAFVAITFQDEIVQYVGTYRHSAVVTEDYQDRKEQVKGLFPIIRAWFS